MSFQLTLPGTLSATSSRESGGGVSHSGSPDGATSGLSGRVPAHASLSARQAQEGGLLTSGTCGLPGTGSSDSANLQSYLENRLRERLTGSDLCEVTWRRWDTPWGQCLLRPRALVRTTRGTDFGLLPTLTAKQNLFSPSMQKWPRHRSLLPTLTAHDYRGGAKPERTVKMRETSKRGTDLATTLRALFPGSTGLINPWWAGNYMGFPDGWMRCAPTGTPSSRKSRRK